MSQKIEVRTGSSNVFADLGLENSDELLVKAELTRKISSTIAQQEMSLAEAIQVLKLKQTELSNLINGQLDCFSTEQLFRFLNALGQDVEILVKAKSQSHSQAQTKVVAP